MNGLQISRPVDQISQQLSTDLSLRFSQRLQLGIEQYISSLPAEKQPAARQELPYLVQFGPILIEYGKQLPDIRWVNPGIYYGGLTEYNKQAVYEWFPRHFQLQTIHISEEQLPSLTHINSLIDTHQLQFPLMKKAERGERGVGVYFLPDRKALEQHWHSMETGEIERSPACLQEYCELPQEYCLQFYQQTDVLGNIQRTFGGLTLRDIPIVVGDSKQTVVELIGALPLTDQQRHRIITKLRQTEPEILQSIPPSGETVTIVRTASIDYGTTYRNITLSLTQVQQMDTLLAQLLSDISPQQFGVGRFDLKAASLEELLAGNLKLIEVNGGAGIPTHVYDERLTIREKYAELRKHFDLMYQIAERNKTDGVMLTDEPVLPWVEFLKISYQSIAKKGIRLFNTDNPQAAQIHTIYKDIFQKLRMSRRLRWKHRFQSLLSQILRGKK